MTASMDDIIEDPKVHFDTPDHVLKADRFNHDEKKKILQAWHEDALALERAKGEGMTGGARSWLHDVDDALEELENSNAVPPNHSN